MVLDEEVSVLVWVSVVGGAMEDKIYIVGNLGREATLDPPPPPPRTTPILEATLLTFDLCTSMFIDYDYELA